MSRAAVEETFSGEDGLTVAREEGDGDKLIIVSATAPADKEASVSVSKASSANNEINRISAFLAIQLVEHST